MPTPRRLTAEDLSDIREYVSYEPEMNLFITGDIEQFGLRDPVNAYAFENPDGTWDSIVVRFYANFVVYSQDPLYDAHAVAKFIRRATGDSLLGSINGKLEVLGPLSSYFEDLSLRSLNMARCVRVDEDAVSPLPEGVSIRRLTPNDYDAMFQLLGSMHMYRGLYDSRSAIALAKQQHAANEARGCMSYGAFLDGELVSCASTGAASSEGAMIVGVGTRMDMRLEGIGSAVVAEVAQRCLDEDKRFVCVFYEGPEAGPFVQRLGFRRLGSYAMLR